MQFLICLRHKCGYRCFWICKTNVKSRLRECPQHPHMYITCTFGVVQKGRCPLSLPHPPYKICKFPAENVSTLTELLRYSCCLSNSSIIQGQGRELHQVPWTCIELHQVLFSPHVASLGRVSYSYHIFKHTKKCTHNSLLIQERCSSFKDGHKKYIEDPLTEQLLTSWNPFVKLIQETTVALKRGMSKILRSEGRLNSHISFVKHICFRADLNQVNSLTSSLPLRIGILQYMKSRTFYTSNQLSYLTY